MTETVVGHEMTNNARTLTGRVISDRMQKTVTVVVERKVRDPLVGKILRRTKKYHAHDAEEQCQIGDLVNIVECRPLSKTKTWLVQDIIEKAEQA